MADVFISEDTLTAIGDAIRAKTGETELINPVDMANKIEEIKSNNKLGQLVGKTITEVTAEDLKGVGEISSYAFSGCHNLREITIPDSVISIGSDAFYACSSLTSLTIPNSVTFINNNAFNSSALTSITIPDSVIYIGSTVIDGTPIYEDDSNWKDGMLYVDNCLMTSNYDILPSSCIIKDGTRVIANNVFNWCKNLTSVTIPDSVIAICGYVFSYCSSLTSVTIGNSVTIIGNSAFSYCSSLTDIIIPDSVITIGDHAFEGCTGLTSVTIGDSVTTINSCAFRDCSNLTSVTIPNSVTDIGGWAFYNCASLTDLIIEGDSVKDLMASDAFPSTPISDGTGYIYIKPISTDVDEATLVEEYKNATNWTAYASQIKGYSEYLIEGE